MQVPFIDLAAQFARDEGPLRVLITNITLRGRTGTEVQTRNIALELLRQGHCPIVYSPRLGALADELRAASVPVVDDIGMIRGTVDVIHGHHTPTTATAIARFPDCPAIFVCHDFTAWHDAPPHLPAIRRTLAVDDAVADRLVAQEGLSPASIRVLLNAVDIERFAPGPPLPPRPRRALAFAKNRGHLDAIRAACSAGAISLDTVGAAVGTVADKPETLMQEYDIVFASALTAMEAMACGRAVIVVDGRGLAGMADPDRFARWRRLNFGLRTLRHHPTPETIAREIARYDPADAAAVSAELRREGGMPVHVACLVAIYREVIAEAFASPLNGESASRALAIYLQRWAPGEGVPSPWLRERDALLATIERLRSPVEVLSDDVALEFSQLDDVRTGIAVRGFSAPEEWGMWSDGEAAMLMLRTRAGRLDALELHFLVHAFVHPDRPAIEADVVVNGTPLDTWDFGVEDGGTATTKVVVVQPQVLAGDGALWIEFRIHGARSPEELHISSDTRKLGIGLRSVVMRAIDS